MKRIPLNVVTAALYQRLTEHQTIPVYDDVLPDADAPYISFGLFTCKDDGTKTDDICNVTANIDVWSNYAGKKEVNEISNDIITLIKAALLDLSADGFKHLDSEVDFFESFSEDDSGYHGVITFIFKIQNMEV